jgi:transposase
VHCLVRRFEDHKLVAPMESFGLLARLYAEQCVTPTSKEPDKVALREKPSSASLQSPADPDATYGHKGKGYEAQLTETCDEQNPFQAVTSVGVNGANESDHQHVVPALEQVARTCGEAPETMHADAGYASGENIIAAIALGTDLAAPIGSKGPEDGTPTLKDFTFDEAGQQVMSCPRGEVPIEQRGYGNSATRLAFFTRKQCAGCPMRSQCPVTKTRGGKRMLRFRATEVAVTRRRAQQATSAFKSRHRIRSGIEATNSELKRCHRLGKLRVRTRKRVALSVRLKVLALNIKRYVAHLLHVAAVPPAPAACTG